MSIQVNDFQWEPGKNDAKYIKLLESSRDEWQRIAQKAIAKLKVLSKAQEARVMTLEEVKQWCETHPHKQNPIWVEFQHGYGTDGWRVGLVNSGLLAWCKDNEARCWTSRPDQATREAIPWE